MDTKTHGHGHGDDTSGYVNPEALQRGHEEDKIDVKSILYVPLALVATFVLAYVVVTLIINYVRAPSTEAPANPVAASRNKAPINERFERIDSTNPNAEYKQPRLEGLQRVEGNDEPYWRSMTALKDKKNPRWFHPEDMRISSEYAKELGLQSYMWVDEHKKALQIPVTEAMKIALAAKDPGNPAVGFIGIAKEPIPRDDLKDQSKPSNPHWGATSGTHHGPVHKDEKDHKESKGKDLKGKDHKD